jgi:hypothetical protein
MCVCVLREYIYIYIYAYVNVYMRAASVSRSESWWSFSHASRAHAFINEWMDEYACIYTCALNIACMLSRHEFSYTFTHAHTHTYIHTHMHICRGTWHARYKVSSADRTTVHTSHKITHRLTLVCLSSMSVCVSLKYECVCVSQVWACVCLSSMSVCVSLKYECVCLSQVWARVFRLPWWLCSLSWFLEPFINAQRADWYHQKLVLSYALPIHEFNLTSKVHLAPLCPDFPPHFDQVYTYLLVSILFVSLIHALSSFSTRSARARAHTQTYKHTHHEGIHTHTFTHT